MRKVYCIAIKFIELFELPLISTLSIHNNLLLKLFHQNYRSQNNDFVEFKVTGFKNSKINVSNLNVKRPLNFRIS
jgi:hypothetical protein